MPTGIAGGLAMELYLVAGTGPYPSGALGSGPDNQEECGAPRLGTGMDTGSGGPEQTDHDA